MIIGQAAGVAAALAVRTHSAVQQISIQKLQDSLRTHHTILHIGDEYHAANPQ
jgi:hypothetical protein